MNQMNPHKTGLALGTFAGGLHVLWAVFVFLGWAQPLLNFIFMLHMIKPIFMIDAFNIVLAGALIVITAAVGYVVGRLFAFLWNYVQQ